MNLGENKIKFKMLKFRVMTHIQIGTKKKKTLLKCVHYSQHL